MKAMDEMKRMDEMPRSEAIRQAVDRLPVPPLAGEFTARTMARLQHAEARRRRNGQLLRVLYGVLGTAALVAVAVWAWWRESGSSPLGQLAAWWQELKEGWSLPHVEWQAPELPQITLPTLSDTGTPGMWALAGLLAAAGIVLLIADLLIRRRIAAQQK